MGPIAATLLCYFEPEKVYAALSRLHDTYNMHSIFSPGFPGLLQAIYVQERIMESKMPDVYAAFKKHMISTTSYATKWYITLFANSVPFQTQLRLWDVYLLEGEDLFSAVAISIVWVYRGMSLFLSEDPYSNSINRSHNIQFCQFRNHTLPSILFLRTRRRRLTSILDRTHARRQKAAIADGTMASRLE
jgi:hypothetical protein